jgi:hypothetical protein
MKDRKVAFIDYALTPGRTEKRFVSDKSIDSDSDGFDESYFVESAKIDRLMFNLGRARGVAKQVPMRGHVFGFTQPNPSEKKTTK